MATNELTARVTLQGEIKANATLGVPVEVYVDREIYDGETDITPTEDDITLETAGKAVLDDILIHGIPQVPHTVVASGSFVKQGTGVTYTLDTHSTKWTKLLIKPHTFPHTGMAQSALSRAIMVKFIDLELDAMISAYMSSAGNAYNAGSYQRISENEECIVTDGVVTMTGEQARVGKWIGGIQYDWYAWNDGEETEPDNVVEGTFEATETGVLTIDLEYDGDKFPKFAMIQPVSGISDDAFLSSENKFINAINTHIMSKSTGATPTYQGGGGVNSARQMSTYVRYQTSYDITATSGSPYSQEPPSTTAATCLRFSDNKTMKIYAESVDEETHHLCFAAGIKYKYRVLY